MNILNNSRSVGQQQQQKQMSLLRINGTLIDGYLGRVKTFKLGYIKIN